PPPDERRVRTCSADGYFLARVALRSTNLRLGCERLITASFSICSSNAFRALIAERTGNRECPMRTLANCQLSMSWYTRVRETPKRLAASATVVYAWLR